MRAQIARVASVNVLGRPPKRTKSMGERMKLLNEVIDALGGRWADRDLDAVLFPAGFFKIDGQFGPVDSQDRARWLETSELGPACMSVAERLAIERCGLLVTGIDTRPARGFSGDQLMVAWSPDGVAGVARKLFPSDGDTNESDGPAYLLFEQDFIDWSRVVKTPTGNTALLCDCYDAFALAEMAIGPTLKRSAMRYVFDEQFDWRWLSAEDRDSLLESFAELVSEAEADLVLVGVHRFKRPGQETYWQRHGIATASAALGGALVVGAAHFRRGLPDPGDLARAALACVGAPRKKD